MNNSHLSGRDSDPGFNNFLENYAVRVTRAAARYWENMPEYERGLLSSVYHGQRPTKDECPKPKKACAKPKGKSSKKPKKACPMKCKSSKPKSPKLKSGPKPKKSGTKPKKCCRMPC